MKNPIVNKPLFYGATVLLAVTLAGLLIFNLVSGKQTATADLQKSSVSISYGADSRSSIYAPENGGGFFIASKDGLHYYDKSGKELLSDAYNMTLPVMVGEGNYVAVAEKDGSSIYVYSTENTTGPVYVGQTDEPIISFALNTAGYISAITQNGAHYKIVTFNDKGTRTYGELTDENVIPLASDISNDGRILAISFADYNGAELNSVIEFSYINKSDSLESQSDVFASNTSNNGQMIGIIRFMADNVLLAVSEQELCAIDTENSAKKIWSYAYPNTITALDCGDSYFALSYGGALPNMDSLSENTVRIYDMSLNLLGETVFSQNVTYLHCSNKAVIAGGRSALAGYGLNGGELWTYNVSSENATACFVGSTSRIAVFTATKTEILSLGAASATESK